MICIFEGELYLPMYNSLPFKLLIRLGENGSIVYPTQETIKAAPLLGIISKIPGVISIEEISAFNDTWPRIEVKLTNIDPSLTNITIG